MLVYAGLTGVQGWWLWVALGLLAVETVVFAGNGMTCPLTALAIRYGAEKGYAFDTFLPERATRHAFRFFGSLMLVGLVLLAMQWLGRRPRPCGLQAWQAAPSRGTVRGRGGP